MKFNDTMLKLLKSDDDHILVHNGLAYRLILNQDESIRIFLMSDTAPIELGTALNIGLCQRYIVTRDTDLLQRVA